MTTHAAASLGRRSALGRRASVGTGQQRARASMGAARGWGLAAGGAWDGVSGRTPSPLRNMALVGLKPNEATSVEFGRCRVNSGRSRPKIRPVFEIMCPAGGRATYNFGPRGWEDGPPTPAPDERLNAPCTAVDPRPSDPMRPPALTMTVVAGTASPLLAQTSSTRCPSVHKLAPRCRDGGRSPTGNWRSARSSWPNLGDIYKLAEFRPVPFICGAPRHVLLHSSERLFKSVRPTPTVIIRCRVGSPDAARHAATASLATAAGGDATNMQKPSQAGRLSAQARQCHRAMPCWAHDPWAAQSKSDNPVQVWSTSGQWCWNQWPKTSQRWCIRPRCFRGQPMFEGQVWRTSSRIWSKPGQPIPPDTPGQSRA